LVKGKKIGKRPYHPENRFSTKLGSGAELPAEIEAQRTQKVSAELQKLRLTNAGYNSNFEPNPKSSTLSVDYRANG
jgi:hypothetical protein